LAEKRPSVLVGQLLYSKNLKHFYLNNFPPYIGDRILVQQHGTTDGRWYEGHVHAIRQLEVLLCFHSSFNRHPEGQRFHVRFKLNRIPLRRQHQALGSAFTEDRILFPLATHLTPGAVPTPRTASIRLYNKLISSNPPQLQAVTSICNLSPGSPPFVLFGPYVSSLYFLFRQPR
jgi:helicase MOV-10